MSPPKNKQDLFSHLDNIFNTALDINRQNDVWIGCINQSLRTNPLLIEIVGDDHQIIWREYIEDRAKRGLKADYD